MKVALCFSGQLRFVNEYSDYIFKNLINMYDVDVYAHLWWNEEMLNKPFHHEFNDVYKEIIEDFMNIYNPKKIKVEPKYALFNENDYEYVSKEYDLQLDKNTIKEFMFRMESQWYSVRESFNLIENPEQYDFIVRIRTDCFIQNPILLNELSKNILYIQSGKCAGPNRKYCDWFAVGNYSIMKYYMNDTYDYVKKFNSKGMIHIHNFIEKITFEFPCLTTDYEFNIPINHMFYKHKKLI